MAFQTSNGSPNITIMPPKIRKKKILGLLSQAPVSCTSISQEDVQNMSLTVHATNNKELLKILEDGLIPGKKNHHGGRQQVHTARRQTHGL